MSTRAMTIDDNHDRCAITMSRLLCALEKLRRQADAVEMPSTPWSRDRVSTLSLTTRGRQALWALLRAAGPRVAGHHACVRGGQDCNGTAFRGLWGDDRALWLVDVAWDCGSVTTHRPAALTLLDPGEIGRQEVLR